MKFSEKKILTTHAGSLPRSAALSEMLGKKSHHQSIDERALDQMIAESTRHVIAAQLEAGIDVGNNGEQGRESFFTYIQHRMSGFSGRSERPIMSDLVHYPGFIALKAPDFARIKVDLTHAPKATGAVRYTAPRGDQKRVRRFQTRARGKSKTLRRSVHERALARHRRGRDAERTLRLDERIRGRARRRAQDRVRRRSSTRASCSSSIAPTSRWSATRCSRASR